MSRINIKFDTLEMMLFFWDSIAQREKIGEAFIREVADSSDMKYLYGTDFNEESVRKVLSAISNRELMNHPTKKESRFWNCNMWMLEDLQFMNMMLSPIKTLNLDYLKDKLQKEEYNIVFVPGHVDEFYIKDNTLVINFFKLVVDANEPSKITIGCELLKEYIEEKLISM